MVTTASAGIRITDSQLSLATTDAPHRFNHDGHSKTCRTFCQLIPENTELQQCEAVSELPVETREAPIWEIQNTG